MNTQPKLIIEGAERARSFLCPVLDAEIREAAFAALDPSAGPVARSCAEATTAAGIEAILATDAAFEAVCSRSYGHPLGFEKLVLWTGAADEPELRLHVWPLKGAEADVPHDHAWDLAVKVLDGVIGFSHHATRTGTGYQVTRVYPYKHVDRTYERASEIEGCDLKLTNSVILPAGAHYFLPAGNVHSAWAERSATLDLIFQGPFRFGSCRVMYPRSDDGVAPHRLKTQLLAPARVREVLQRALTHLRHG